MAAAAPPPVFRDDQTAFLTDWFSEYASDPTAEIEVRIKGVQASEFDRMLHRLSSSTSWSSCTTSCTVDVALPDEVRGSYEPGQPHTLACMSKRRIERPVDVQTLPPYSMHVRFSLSRETPVPSPSSDAAVHAAVTSGFCRIKSRHTFVHKGQFAFELTRVQTGRGETAATRAPPEGEVEIEWCGQRVVAADAKPHTLAASMLFKVADLVRMVQEFRTFGRDREPLI